MKKDLIVKWYDELDSTNNEAMRQISEADDLSVWVARRQTAGRGQRGNSWESADNENLTFSILLRPEHIRPATQFLISEAISLSVLDYLQEKGLEARIKWPNDIYVGDRKICGILIEHSLIGDRLSASIIGVGLNVNQKEFFSDAPNPVSMYQLKACTFQLENELEKLLCNFIKVYEDADSGDPDRVGGVERRYLEHMYRRGEKHWYIDRLSGKKIEGVILGVDEFACLRLETPEGEKRYAFKEISYVL